MSSTPLTEFSRTMGTEKTVDHPALGSVSCDGLLKAYKNCSRFVDKDAAKAGCTQYHDLAQTCYLMTSTEFLNHLDRQIEIRQQYKKFMLDNGSSLLQMQEKMGYKNFFDRRNQGKQHETLSMFERIRREKGG